jgi:hypothetical protein
MKWDEVVEPPPRRLRRRFGTGRLFECQGPGRYVAVTPLGMPLTRDGGQPEGGLAVERRRADRTVSRPAGWYPVAPKSWGLTAGYATARLAAHKLDLAISAHDAGPPRLVSP